MDTKTETPNSNGQSNGAAMNGKGLAGQDDVVAENARQNMLHRIKAAIDEKGRYSYRLNDMAAGYAAGKGISSIAARKNIEDQFIQQFNVSPKTYLEAHYDEMRENGYNVGPSSDDGEERPMKRTFRKGRGR